MKWKQQTTINPVYASKRELLQFFSAMVWGNGEKLARVGLSALKKFRRYMRLSERTQKRRRKQQSTYTHIDSLEAIEICETKWKLFVVFIL